MELTGEYRIPAPREHVWAMLNDPAVLRACIPGCETLEGSAESGFSARVTTKVGPVKATFNGSFALSNVNPPQSYTISGEGKGGVAGFAKGGADVHLAAEGAAATLLTYTVNAQVGGKLAQLGSRLIDSTAKKLAEQFFTCFAERAGGSALDPTVAMQPEAPVGALEASPVDAASNVILPGTPIPPQAAGVPIVESQAAAPEAVPPIPAVAAVAGAPLTDPAARTAASGVSIEGAAHEVEEEIERKAAVGFLGGPIVWGLLALLALLFVYVIAS